MSQMSNNIFKTRDKVEIDSNFHLETDTFSGVCLVKSSTPSVVASITFSTTLAVFSKSPVTASVTTTIGDTTTFNVYLYLNGTVQGDTFTFALANNNVPSANYTLITIDGNHFSVQNKLVYLTYPLSITCTSGSNVRTVPIALKGSY